jgi:flagellar biosynthesis protein FlhF
MKIKKYEAPTDQEAILKVKEDLGKDAVILNIKKIQPRGIFKLFKKQSVEVTAAYEDKAVEENLFQTKLESFQQKPIEKQQDVGSLEKKIDNLESLLSKISTKMSDYENTVSKNNVSKYRNLELQILYDNLIENDVLPEIAHKLLEGLDEIIQKDSNNINIAIKTVYSRIVQAIGKVEPIYMDHQNKPKVIVIMGPTGVGKTTTIAKLSSLFILKEGANIGLITADTYRIAAVEQLKVYAEILGIETKVIYSENEMASIFDSFADKDIIFVDTAGRSHKNTEQFNDLNLMLQHVSDCEKYLVLSITTKNKDLLDIINTYSEISEYNIIFTKADETTTKGAILNICYLTGKSVSYITNGQNVPDDIELIKPEEIAKALLGSIDK